MAKPVQSKKKKPDLKLLGSLLTDKGREKLKMGRPTDRTCHPFIARLMDEQACDNVNQFALKVGISDSTMYGYAFEGRLPNRNDTRLADACGLTQAELFTGLMQDQAS